MSDPERCYLGEGGEISVILSEAERAEFTRYLDTFWFLTLTTPGLNQDRWRVLYVPTAKSRHRSWA